MFFKTRKKGNIRKLSIFLILLFILSMFNPFTQVLAKNKAVEEKKIEKSINNLYKDNNYVSSIIYFKDQLGNEDILEEEVVDRLKEISKNSQEKVINYLNKEKKRGNVLSYEPFFIVNAIQIKAKKNVIRKVAKLEEVEYIYEDKKISVDEPIERKKDNIKKQKSSYYNDNIGWNIKRIRADEVWQKYNVKGDGVVIGVIDSGALLDHESIKEKWRGYNKNDSKKHIVKGNWYDATGESELPEDEEAQPHGTHVTGIILGSEKDKHIGVAPNAKWISAKAFTLHGGYDSWLLKAGEWMIAPDGDPSKAPDIINNSWGGNESFLGNEYNWYRDMVKAWRKAGILPVFAAGNGKSYVETLPKTIAVPSSYPESFAVTAIDSKNKLAKFARRGPTEHRDKNGDLIIKPEISAPGVNINSCVKDGYEAWDGTSMAAPHISGVAALMLSVNRDLTVDDIEKIIEETAVPLPKKTNSPNFDYGYGLIDALAAVEKAMSYNGDISKRFKITGRLVDNEDNIIKSGKISIGNYSDGRFKSLFTSEIDQLTGKFKLTPYLNKSKLDDTYIIKVEADGYKDIEKEISLKENNLNDLLIKLDDLEHYNISGRVVDRKTRNVINDVEIVLYDKYRDRHYTNKDGVFNIRNMKEGKYNISFKKYNYLLKSFDIDINKDIILGDIELEPLSSLYTEKIFDNGNYLKGIAEESNYFNNKGETGIFIEYENKESAELKGLKVYIADKNYSTGNKIGIVIYNNDRDKNIPKYMIHTPKFFHVALGQWNYLDMSDLNISLEKDKYYIATIQEFGYSETPYIGIDNSKNEYFNYLYYNTEEYYLPKLNKNINRSKPMVRPVIKYNLENIYISDIGNNNKTYNKIEELIIKSDKDSNVKLYNNNNYIDELKLKKGKNFYKIKLTKGSNKIDLVREIDGEKFILETINLYYKEKEDNNDNIIKPEEDIEDKEEYKDKEDKDKEDKDKEDKDKEDKDKEDKDNILKDINFEDLDGFEWAKDEITYLAEKGIIKGRNSLEFDPSSNISRAEYTSMIIRILKKQGINIEKNKNKNKNMKFQDVKKDSWYYNEINKAYKYGLVDGVSQYKFNPNDNITREEAVKILGNCVKKLKNIPEFKYSMNELVYKDMNTVSDWARNEVSFCTKLSLIKGYDSKFHPKLNLNRAEGALIIYRLFKLI